MVCYVFQSTDLSFIPLRIWNHASTRDGVENTRENKRNACAFYICARQGAQISDWIYYMGRIADTS